MTRRILMVGNWKMNQSLGDIRSFFETIKIGQRELCKNAWIAPQLIHLQALLESVAGTEIKIGAQNCSEHQSGAFTGETSPAALKDLGAHFTLIGHSERRSLYGETCAQVAAKTKAALENGLTPIVCVGETLAEREAGQTLNVVLGQVQRGLQGIPEDKKNNIIIAYEPVWAIGTGKVAGPAEAQEVHAAIRATLAQIGLMASEISILYGGSVKPDNVASLLECPDIDGGLVGGASLKASDYLVLCKAAKERE